MQLFYMIVCLKMFTIGWLTVHRRFGEKGMWRCSRLVCSLFTENSVLFMFCENMKMWKFGDANMVAIRRSNYAVL